MGPITLERDFESVFVISLHSFFRFLAIIFWGFQLLGVAAQTPAPIFVLNSLDGNVSVIDPVTWKEKKRIPTGKEPHHLYLTPDEKSVIVANAMSDSLTFIDPRTAQFSARSVAFWTLTTCAFHLT